MHVWRQLDPNREQSHGDQLSLQKMNNKWPHKKNKENKGRALCVVNDDHTSSFELEEKKHSNDWSETPFEELEVYENK